MCRYLLFFLALLVCVPSTASAQERLPTNDASGFESYVAAGKRAYSTGDYALAVRAFKKGFELRPEANLLYNIARSYDSAGDLDEAEVYYNRFILSPGISQSSRADAVDRLKTISDYKKVKAEQGRTPEKSQTGSEGKGDEGSSTSAIPWILGGAGVLLIGGGIATGIVSDSEFSSLEARGYPNIPESEAQDAASEKDTATTMRTASYLLLGAGALVTIGGVVSYFLLNDSGDEKQVAEQWKVTPVTTTSTVGLSVQKAW